MWASALLVAGFVFMNDEYAKTAAAFLVLGLVVGFFIGEAYRTGALKKVMSYCIENNSNKEEIAGCLTTYFQQEKDEVDSYRDY